MTGPFRTPGAYGTDSWLFWSCSVIPVSPGRFFRRLG